MYIGDIYEFFFRTPGGQVRHNLMLRSGVNYSSKSIQFKFLVIGNSINYNNTIDENYFVYIQNYVLSLITIANLPQELKDARDNAFKLVNENYNSYTKFIYSKLGIKQEDIEKLTEKVNDPSQNIRAVQSIATNKDGSPKGFSSINDLLSSVNSIIEKK